MNNEYTFLPMLLSKESYFGDPLLKENDFPPDFINVTQLVVSS